MSAPFAPDPASQPHTPRVRKMHSACQTETTFPTWDPQTIQLLRAHIASRRRHAGLEPSSRPAALGSSSASSGLTPQRAPAVCAPLRAQLAEEAFEADVAAAARLPEVSATDYMSKLHSQEYMQLCTLRERLCQELTDLGASVYDVVAFKDVLLAVADELPPLPVRDLVLLSSRLHRRCADVVRSVAAMTNITFADDFCDGDFAFTDHRLTKLSLRRQEAACAIAQEALTRSRDRCAMLEEENAALRAQCAGLTASCERLLSEAAQAEAGAAQLRQDMGDVCARRAHATAEEALHRLELHAHGAPARVVLLDHLEAARTRLEAMLRTLRVLHDDLAVVDVTGTLRTAAQAVIAHAEGVRTRFGRIQPAVQETAEAFALEVAERRRAAELSVAHLGAFRHIQRKLDAARAAVLQARLAVGPWDDENAADGFAAAVAAAASSTPGRRRQSRRISAASAPAAARPSASPGTECTTGAPYDNNVRTLLEAAAASLSADDIVGQLHKMVARPTASTAKATDRAFAHPAPALAAVAGDPYAAPRTTPALDGAAEEGGSSSRGHNGEIESSPGAVAARAAAAATAAAAAAAIALPAGRYRSAAAFMQAAFEARLHEVETSVAATATAASSAVANTASQAEAAVSGGLSAASAVQSDGLAGRQRPTHHGSPATRRSKEHAPAQHSPRSGPLGAAGATDTAAGLNAPVAAWDQARRGIVVAATSGGAFANRDNADTDTDASGGFGMRTAQDVFDALVRDRAARSTT